MPSSSPDHSQLRSLVLSPPLDYPTARTFNPQKEVFQNLPDRVCQRQAGRGCRRKPEFSPKVFKKREISSLRPLIAIPRADLNSLSVGRHFLIFFSSCTTHSHNQQKTSSESQPIDFRLFLPTFTRGRTLGLRILSAEVGNVADFISGDLVNARRGGLGPRKTDFRLPQGSHMGVETLPRKLWAFRKAEVSPTFPGTSHP